MTRAELRDHYLALLDDLGPWAPAFGLPSGSGAEAVFVLRLREGRSPERVTDVFTGGTRRANAVAELSSPRAVLATVIDSITVRAQRVRRHRRFTIRWRV
jgi:hypothetical protein